MSLKGFHILFVTLSTVLAFGFGLWSLNAYMVNTELMMLALGMFSIAGGGFLIWYGIRIRRKLNQLGFKWGIRGTL